MISKENKDRYDRYIGENPKLKCNRCLADEDGWFSVGKDYKTPHCEYETMLGLCDLYRESWYAHGLVGVLVGVRR